jgi:hypothetical protein
MLKISKNPIAKLNIVLLAINFDLLSSIKSVFGSVVAGAFQITFRAKMHVNDVFLFFKNYF